MTEETIMETLKVQPLSEEEKKSRGILKRLMGPIASCKEGTRNGRKYNRELWENALNDDIFKEKIATKSLFLELGHPDREETHMDCACACIPEMPKIIDGDLYAVVDVLDTPAGKVLNTLIDYGFQPGISSRGSGDVIEGFGGESEVDPETFFLETWDIVQTPALKKARLSVMESLDGEKVKLEKALGEELESSNDDDRKIMVESLRNVGIDMETTHTPEDDKAVEGDDKKEASSENLTEGAKAIDNGNAKIIEELKDAIRKKSELESTVRSLQERLAVSDAKVGRIEEEYGKCKSTVVRLTTLARDAETKSKLVEKLEAEIKRKDEGLRLLNKTVVEGKMKLESENASLKESLAEKDSMIATLRRKVRESKDGYETEIKSLRESIENDKAKNSKRLDETKAKYDRASKLAEGYKRLANDVVDRYIKSKAVTIGVEPQEIRNRLSESYTLDEIDSVCEKLKSYSLNLGRLPIKLGKKSVVKIQESKTPEQKAANAYFDDDVDEHSMRIAGLL